MKFGTAKVLYTSAVRTYVLFLIYSVTLVFVTSAQYVKDIAKCDGDKQRDLKDQKKC